MFTIAHACPWLGECPSVVCGIRIFLTHSRNCFYQLLLYPAFTAVGDCVLLRRVVACCSFSSCASKCFRLSIASSCALIMRLYRASAFFNERLVARKAREERRDTRRSLSIFVFSSRLDLRPNAFACRGNFGAIN